MSKKDPQNIHHIHTVNFSLIPKQVFKAAQKY